MHQPTSAVLALVTCPSNFLVDNHKSQLLCYCQSLNLPAPKVKITFEADSLKVAEPRVDGSYTLSFSVGQHQQLEVAKLLTIPQ